MSGIKLAATVAYVMDSYPTYDLKRYARVEKELNAAIIEHGITAIRTYLKNMVGAVTLVKTWPENTYTFKRCTRTMQFDFEQRLVNFPTHLKALEYRRISAKDIEYTESGVNNSNCYVFVSKDHPKYYGHHLWEWIESGKECEDCGSLYFGPEDVCNTCLHRYEARSYNHRVEDELGMENTKEIRYGVELEYERITARDVFRTLKGHALPKRDGSIHDGVEVVTRPATIATHKQALKSFYDKIKVKPEHNTGMHVHIERSKLSQFQIGFMMEFLNHKKLIPFISVVAGRKYADNTYCRPNEAYNMTYGVYFDPADWKLKRSNTDKYTPLNTAKTHTVEVRIFSSPKDHEECAAKLDFVAALVAYSSPYSVSVKNLKEKYDWQLFLKFVEKNRSQYKDFFKYYVVPNKFRGVSL